MKIELYANEPIKQAAPKKLEPAKAPEVTPFTPHPPTAPKQAPEKQAFERPAEEKAKPKPGPAPQVEVPKPKKPAGKEKDKDCRLI